MHNTILRLVCGLILPLFLSACSNVSRFDVPKDGDTPSVKSIVDQVRCEIGILAREDYPHHEALITGDFVVAVQLTLTVNDDGSLAPSFTYTNGLFSFSAGAKLEASREQNFTQKLIFSIAQMRDEIREARRRHLPFPFPCAKFPDTELATELGIKSAADMAFLAPNANLDSKLSGTDGAFGGYVTFIITKNLNMVGPTWTLTHFKGPGNLAGFSEMNTDKLAFAFAQSSATGLLPIEPRAALRLAAVPGAPKSAKAEILLNQILTGELATQLGAIRVNTR